MKQLGGDGVYGCGVSDRTAKILPNLLGRLRAQLAMTSGKPRDVYAVTYPVPAETLSAGVIQSQVQAEPNYFGCRVTVVARGDQSVVTVYGLGAYEAYGQCRSLSADASAEGECKGHEVARAASR